MWELFEKTKNIFCTKCIIAVNKESKKKKKIGNYSVWI